MGIRRSLRKLLGYKEPESFLNDSFAIEGEDMILDRVFNQKATGFYVDIGALHPVRYSNTYKFYKRGWRGVNVDAMPGSMKLFNITRPLDVNLEIPVSNKTEILPFYIFNEPALNTFSKEMADERTKKEEYFVKDVVNIETHSLLEILTEHVPPNQKIDFLTIDAEGFDFLILQSNNWSVYRPLIVLIESDLSYTELFNSDITSYMENNGYSLYAKTVKTCFFKCNTFNIAM